MNNVNFSILGCGKIGTRHAVKMMDIKNIKLTSVCDIIPERAKSLAEKYNCKYYVRIEDMLKDKDIDFVNICTPSGLHSTHSIQCLNAKKNVLCEKPMALTVYDAKKMVEAANNNNKFLYIVKQNRYNPPVKLVKELMDEGKLGEPIICVVNMFWNRDDNYYNSDPWRGTKKLDGGTIFTQASHFIDLMLMYMGKAKTVYSLMGTKKHKIEIEDTGTITAKFINGSYGVMNYTTCATKKNFEGSITLICSKGTVKIGGEYINTIDYFQVEDVDLSDFKDALNQKDVGPNDYGTYKGSMSNHDQIFKDILETTNDQRHKNKLVFGDEAIETVEFIEAAKMSAEKEIVINI